ncbi:hypothetical protein CONLIGDRAFT_574104 [Coniochaeta ligniaria NRRL 30616]|uniref:2EXR domain-containing protein n=1 Tax=Coniochaeta ligniaria NRRL 30616 TaxID=1408157 RepID=A0A1J7JCA6_9PEZI|nr:hypothetical protein CONLIGDRAFT_574104 [Coniochaeta ligniaria NRRL 30616]
MDQTDQTDVSSLPAPKLFNDVYFGQQPPPVHETWSQFSRLPVDLRLQIWLVFLRQHRMIEVTICPDENEDDTTYPGGTDVDGRYYTSRNHLGSIISGRGYTLKIPGQGYAATFSPLLWVNRESRDAALSHCYRVHLPYPSEHAGQLLYLNTDYDVLKPSPEFRRAMPPATWLPPAEPRAATVLVDFLHDVKAFDPKHQGILHLALESDYIEDLAGDPDSHPFKPPLTPPLLHPLAAASFTDILSTHLRSLFFAMNFRNSRRGMGEFSSEKLHFAQTFPLRRRGNPTGAFVWLDTDPRAGLEFDLVQVTPMETIANLLHVWNDIQKAFGVDGGGVKLRLYVCPALQWPKPPRFPTPPPEPPQTQEGWREALAGHLRWEEGEWAETRREWNSWLSTRTKPKDVPRHGLVVDRGTFEMMERVPVTAVGMWVFPVKVFDREPVNARKNSYDLRDIRPGLFLFEL